MQNMFYYSAIESLDLSNFDTLKVKDMSSMFSRMSNIEELNLSSFNTSNVTNMSGMFNKTKKLRSLDISNFDTSKVTNFNEMFSNEDSSAATEKLEHIYIKHDFDLSSGATFQKLFNGRTTLRGGEGSFLPDPSTADKTWLRIDDPVNGRPGYFTRKP